MKKYTEKAGLSGSRQILGLAASLLSCGVLLAAAGCNTFRIKTPPGFVTFKRTWRFYRAVSPDNAVMTARSWKNKPRGTLSFWAEVVEREMLYTLGYTMVKKDKVKAGSGQEGVRLMFKVASRGRWHIYIVALFVTSKRIYVFEAATYRQYLGRHEPAFKGALASMVLL